MLLTSSWILDILVLSATVAVFFYKYSTRKFGYWKKRGVYCPKPTPFLGNFADVCFFRVCIGDWLRKLYDSTDEPYFGIFVFDEPILVLKSPELVKQIMVKDFHNFSDRSVAQPKHNKMISNFMFFQKNPQWKEDRSNLTPVFTSGKLKLMFNLIQGATENLLKYLEKNEGEMESKEVFSKYATDVIATCFFGIDSHCFGEDDSTFRKLGRTMFDFSWRNGFVQSSYFFRKNLVDLLRLDFIEQWVLDYFHEAFSEVVRVRNNGGVKRNDLIDIINEVNNNEKHRSNTNAVDELRLVTQAIQFFAAGFETTSSTITFTLYELCLNKGIQDTVRKEILASIEKHGSITYEGLMEMKYLDMCVKETLRKYPVLPFLDRTCNEDYRLPGTDLVIEKGMTVFISMFGSHFDEKYFPEPDKYDPLRFQNNNFNSEGLVYIPFGEGRRSCIGERFGIMSTKAAIAYVLSNFELNKCAKTPDPMIFDPKSVILQSTVGVPMNLKSIRK